MTRQLLVIVVLRILGILWLGESLSKLVQLGFSWVPGADPNIAVAPSLVRYFAISASGTALVLIPIALLFLLTPKRIATILFPECGDQAVTVSGEGLGQLAFRVLGIVIAVFSFLGLLRAGLQFAWDRTHPVEHFPFDWRGQLSLLAYSVGGVGLGILVYFRAFRLAGRRSYQGGA